MVEVTQADVEAAHAWIRQQPTGLQMMMNKPRGLYEAFARHRASTAPNAEPVVHPAASVEALSAKIAQLQKALVQHNERLRSAASIARRDGRETNWLTFRGAVTYTLAEYRELVSECVEALAAMGERS